MSIRHALSALEMAGLIGLAQAQPELAYAFRHALVQDAAYSSLVRRSRQALHQAAGETLEALFPEAAGRDAHLPELAHHFSEAEDWAKALDYAWRAGREAQGRFAAAEAIALFDRAAAAAARLGRPPPPELLRARGRALDTVGAFDRARADFEAGLAAAHAAGDRRREWESLLDLGFLWTSQDYAQTGDYFRQALDLAERLDDPAARAHSLNRVGNWHVNVERPSEGLGYHQRALAIFQQMGDAPGLAETLDLLGLTEFERGALTRGGAYYAAAIERFRALGDQRGLCSALATYASSVGVSLIHDTLPVAVNDAAPAHEALAVARAIGWRAGEAFGQMMVALVSGLRGEFAQAFAAVRAGEAIAREIEHRQWLIGALLAQGGLHLDLLDPAAALDHLQAAEGPARQVGSLIFQRHLAAALVLAWVGLAERAPSGEREACLAAAERVAAEAQRSSAEVTLAARQLLAARVELMLARAQPAEALRLLDVLRHGPEGEAPEGSVPRLDWLRGRALLALGQPEAAVATLAAAVAGARRLGLHGRLWRLVRDHGRALSALGRVEAAAEARADARRAAAALAEQVPAGALRARFLQQAEVAS
jgi:hypothetical protein